MTTTEPAKTNAQKLKDRWTEFQRLQVETAKALNAVIVTAENLDITAEDANKILGIDLIKQKGPNA